jgi:hypothetical protein
MSLALSWDRCSLTLSVSCHSRTFVLPAAPFNNDQRDSPRDYRLWILDATSYHDGIRDELRPAFTQKQP